jgi:hypothetical protein
MTVDLVMVAGPLDRHAVDAFSAQWGYCVCVSFPLRVRNLEACQSRTHDLPIPIQGGIALIGSDLGAGSSVDQLVAHQPRTVRLRYRVALLDTTSCRL